MIEYLNAIATVLLLLITILSLLGRERLDLQNISERIEPLKNILEFLGNLPKWLDYYNELNSNVQSLHKKNDRLQRRMDDLRTRVEDEEFKTGRSRKKEVDNWLSNVETKESEVQAILEQIDRQASDLSKFIYRAWLGSRVEKKIKEVDDLYISGSFEEVLSYAREAPELVVGPLVGRAPNENITTILAWLRNGVSTIGVHGIRGIGKTAIMKHVHNQILLQNTDTNVYLIEVPEDYTNYDLQRNIANAIGLDLTEEDVLKRAAWLNRALRKKNFVLILDGLKKNFRVEDVGIPLDATKGKMIITSRSRDVCRRMSCQGTVALSCLQWDEGVELFKRELSVEKFIEPLMDDLVRRIVEKCQGVALRIINKAVDLRGVDDISLWERCLNEMVSND